MDDILLAVFVSVLVGGMVGWAFTHMIGRDLDRMGVRR